MLPIILVNSISIVLRPVFLILINFVIKPEYSKISGEANEILRQQLAWQVERKIGYGFPNDSNHQ